MSKDDRPRSPDVSIFLFWFQVGQRLSEAPSDDKRGRLLIIEPGMKRGLYLS